MYKLDATSSGWADSATGRKATGLSGIEGVITAVISQAVADLRDDAHRADALAYFGSATYRDHLAFLGVADGALPVALVEGVG